LNHRDFAPDVLDAFRRPGVRHLCHRRRWCDRVNGAHFVDTIRDVGGGGIAIQDGSCEGHVARTPLMRPAFSGTNLEMRWHCRLTGQTGSRRRGRFGDHLDRVTRALFETNGAARAEVVVDAIKSARAELDDGLLRTGGQTIVTFEAVAAGQASARLVTSLRLSQSVGDFLETRALGY